MFLEQKQSAGWGAWKGLNNSQASAFVPFQHQDTLRSSDSMTSVWHTLLPDKWSANRPTFSQLHQLKITLPSSSWVAVQLQAVLHGSYVLTGDLLQVGSPFLWVCFLVPALVERGWGSTLWEVSQQNMYFLQTLRKATYSKHRCSCSKGISL